MTTIPRVGFQILPGLIGKSARSWTLAAAWLTTVFLQTVLYPTICLGADELASVDSRMLFKPHATLATKLKSSGDGKVDRVGSQWHVTGKAPLRVEFTPADKDAWDASAFRLIAIPIINGDSGVATVSGKLKNNKATSWSLQSFGFAVAPHGVKATLGFPFCVAENLYQGPDIFKDQLAKPNGHRVHWRQFNPEDIRSLTIEVKSSTGKVDLLIDDPFLAWPATPEIDKTLEKLPYLDSLGQVRAVDWPGKASNIQEAGAALLKELDEAASKSAVSTIEQKLGRFGGWSGGPKLQATGHFRTEKVDGKWWLVDPEGHLFFSVGVCSAGLNTGTVVTKKRIDAGFFEYLPDAKSNLGQSSRFMEKSREIVSFLAMNYARTLGDGWETRDRDSVHNRLRAWGMNTLGAWSAEALQRDARTPYTIIVYPGWTAANPKGFPAPFYAGFEDDMRLALQKYEWAKNDPFLLGIFIGNELEWPDQFTPFVFESASSDTTKQWVLASLKTKYESISALNAKWNTTFLDWSQVLVGKANAIPKAARDDIEPLYLDFTKTYFSKCKSAINSVLPNKLYLGCRTHRGPTVIGYGAAGHVDVFSVNMYDSIVRAPQLPADIDMPVIASEFHFGAVDRGVPSPGLSTAWDQEQRGLAFCNYLASALADPRFVGVHWFQWLDQSAAGRPDRENHNCGLIDVTGRSYSELVLRITQATQGMYAARFGEKLSTEQILERLIK